MSLYQRILCAFLVGCCGLSLLGCSGGGALSQEELKRLALSRPSDEEDESPAATPPKQPTSAGKKAEKTVKGGAENAPAASSSKPDAATKKTSLTTQAGPTQQRPKGGPPRVGTVGDAPSSDTNNTSRVENNASNVQTATDMATQPPQTLAEQHEITLRGLQRIADGLEAYAKEHRRYPAPAIYDSTGKPLLSWRVLLLPYLGHSDLYEKFRQDEPWDGPHNGPLLEQMPVEYRAAHRWDTRTNYLVPFGANSAFRAGNGTPIRKFEDGPQNTVLVVEVDDALAVEWTRPSELEISLSQPLNGLGELREGLFLSVWGQGQVLAVKSSLAANYVKGIFTIDGGEPLKASDFGRPAGQVLSSAAPRQTSTSSASSGSGPSVEQTLAGSGAQVAELDDVRQTKRVITQPDLPTSRASKSGPSSSLGGSADRSVAEQQLFPVPNGTDLSSAEKELKQLYREQLGKISSVTVQRTLADLLLKDMDHFEPGSAQAYVAAKTALRLASRSGDVRLSLRAWETLRGMYQIDATDQRFALIEQLIRGKLTSADLKSLKPLIDTAVEEAIGNDQFSRGLGVVAMAYRVATARNDSALQSHFSDQQKMIEEHQAEYLRVKKILESNDLRETDQDSNFIVGRYFCYIKGDWSAGLPLLARGRDPQLAALSQVELNGAASTEERVKLAQGWWQIAQANSGTRRRNIELHTLDLYRQVKDELSTGLVRTQIEHRIRQLERGLAD